VVSFQRENQPAENTMPFDIFTVLGHDLKSPLNAVEAYLEIIRGRILGDSLEPYAEVLENSIARLHHMRELITDVVDWAKIRQPSPSRILTATDISKIARSVVNRYAEGARNRNISISADIEEGLSMKAAAGEIELILRHLIDNAVKYNRDDGSVHVAMLKEGSHIALHVSDTGIGMDAEEQARIFGEFMRIKNARTRGIPGTGLGLSIAKQLVELYRGTITVESDPDKGATFALTLSCGE